MWNMQARKFSFICCKLLEEKDKGQTVHRAKKMSAGRQQGTGQNTGAAVKQGCGELGGTGEKSGKSLVVGGNSYKNKMYNI